MGRLLGITLTAMAELASPASAATPVVDRPVSFSVVNSNHSRVACPSDGRTYELRGSLVGPAPVVNRGRAVTLLIHGAMLPGDKLWRMRPGGDASYDFGLAMARRGRAVVDVELVGYGRSAPDGNLVCQGSMGDVIHQVVNRLRSGDYRFGGGRGPAFRRVGLAGFSFGAQYAQVAAYSFPNIDALVLIGWAEPFLPSLDGTRYTSGVQATCFNGGGRKFGRSGPRHYVRRPVRLALKVQWRDADRRPFRQWTRDYESDPCGIQSSAGARGVADVTGLPSIDVPVLVAFGQHDDLVGWLGPHVLFSRLTGTSDRTLMVLPGAGHGFFLERPRAKWIRRLAGWLDRRGL